VCRSAPLQRNLISQFLRERDDRYFQFAERVASKVPDNQFAASCYADLCRTLMREQVAFNRTGEYSCTDASRAYRVTYSQDSMREYVIGLMLTYLFWPNHYSMMEMFWDHILTAQPKKVLEVGAGHGLFTSEILRLLDADLTIVDISPQSIEICREFVPSSVNLNLTDYITWGILGKFDLVIMGEVIEHVDDPFSFLWKTRGILSEGGSVFVSTCAECPAVDHVYRFRTVEEIREMIFRTGFSIEKELITQAPTTTINYAAVLRKNG